MMKLDDGNLNSKIWTVDLAHAELQTEAETFSWVVKS